MAEMLKVIDNFLPMEDFWILQQVILKQNKYFPWYFNPNNLVSIKPKNVKKVSKSQLEGHQEFQFVHLFKVNNESKSSFDKHLKSCYKKLYEIYPYTNVSRCKANLYTNQGKHIKHGKHQDMYDIDIPYVSAVYQLNKCNGSTVVFDKKKKKFKKIPQKENRIIIFSGNTTHYGITQTDTQIRCIINFVLL